MSDDAAQSGSAGQQPGAGGTPSVHLTFVERNEQIVAFQLGRGAVPEDTYRQLIQDLDAQLAELVVMLTSVNRMRNRTVYALKPGTTTKQEVIAALTSAAQPLGIGVEGDDVRQLGALGRNRKATGTDDDDDEDGTEDEKD